MFDNQQRVEFLVIPFSHEELKQIRRAADSRGQKVTDYLRDRVLQQNKPELPNI